MDHLSQKKKWKRRQRTQRSTRSRQRRTSTDRPRLSVFRSAKNISVQVIDDADARTLASASTMEQDVRAQAGDKTKTEQAQIVGALVGERAKQAGIEEVRFDRGWYRYHGRVRALAEAAREAGLKF